MKAALWIASGGVLGTLARYYCSLWMHSWLGKQFAWGTLFVNVCGCFFLGYLMEHELGADPRVQYLWMLLTIGFMGSYTTFSTFGYETIHFVRTGMWWLALINVFANLGLGFLAIWLGTKLAS